MAQPLEEYDKKIPLFSTHLTSSRWSFWFWQADMMSHLVLSIVALAVAGNAFNGNFLTFEIAYLIGFGAIDLSMVVFEYIWTLVDCFAAWGNAHQYCDKHVPRVYRGYNGSRRAVYLAATILGDCIEFSLGSNFANTQGNGNTVHYYCLALVFILTICEYGLWAYCFVSYIAHLAGCGCCGCVADAKGNTPSQQFNKDATKEDISISAF